MDALTSSQNHPLKRLGEVESNSTLGLSPPTCLRARRKHPVFIALCLTILVFGNQTEGQARHAYQTYVPDEAYVEEVPVGEIVRNKKHPMKKSAKSAIPTKAPRKTQTVHSTSFPGKSNLSNKATSGSRPGESGAVPTQPKSPEVEPVNPSIIPDHSASDRLTGSKPDNNVRSGTIEDLMGSASGSHSEAHDHADSAKQSKDKPDQSHRLREQLPLRIAGAALCLLIIAIYWFMYAVFCMKGQKTRAWRIARTVGLITGLIFTLWLAFLVGTSLLPHLKA